MTQMPKRHSALARPSEGESEISHASRRSDVVRVGASKSQSAWQITSASWHRHNCESKSHGTIDRTTTLASMGVFEICDFLGVGSGSVDIYEVNFEKGSVDLPNLAQRPFSCYSKKQNWGGKPSAKPARSLETAICWRLLNAQRVRCSRCIFRWFRFLCETADFR
jgi:hypothetical protein